MKDNPNRLFDAPEHPEKSMSEEERTMFEAIEYPERFSEEELATMLEDPETRQLYDTMSKTANLLTETTDPDIDAEWNLFVAKHQKSTAAHRNPLIVRTDAAPFNGYTPSRPNRNNTSFLKRCSDALRKGSLAELFKHRAAVVIATIVVSLAVVGASIGIRKSLARTEASEEQSVLIPQKELIAQLPITDKVQSIEPKDSVVTPTIKIFKEENFEELIKQVSAYYGAEVSFQSPTTKSLRLYFKWNQSLPLNEVVEQLNSFEQIAIALDDNILIIE